MAARNAKSVPGLGTGFESTDKMQSSTLKRQPSPDWSKNDLLRLLSYFEGELQARDITIAALKAEKAKQLLYQAKYGRFGLGDPFVALQRDAIGTRDSNFDEASVKSMYDNQLAQLENLIATQRKAQLKMREQLANAEKRYHKVCSELEDEKRKHAQDTAQGDDVTYMLEKERERLRQEIDFEKSNSKKLEKDLRRTLAALEEERASAARHKQVALLLLKERKHILQKASAQQKSLAQGDDSFSEDELRSEDMAEGLDVETRHSLAMEAALEEQLGEFEAERAALRAGLDQEQGRTRELESQVEVLQRQVQSMAARTCVDSIEIKSGVSPVLTGPQSPSSLATPFSSQPAAPVSANLNSSTYSTNSNQTSVRPSSTLTGTSLPGRSVAVIGSGTSTPVVRQVPKVNKVIEGVRVGSTSPEREVIHRPTDSPMRKVQCGGVGYASSGMDRQGSGLLSTSPRGEARVVTVGSSGPDSGPLLVGGGSGARVNISPGNSATVVTQGGGKISFHVSPGAGGVSVGGSGTGSPRRTASSVSSTVCAGRGTPPPVPPNKPNITPISPGGGAKPAPPPKVGVMGRERGGMDSKVVQIPVNVVGSPPSSTSPSPSSSSQSSRESSPIRKTTQLSQSSVDLDVPSAASPNTSLTHPAATLEFLGPEMANLQELLASLSTGEASACDSPRLESSLSSSTYPSPPLSLSTVSPSSTSVSESETQSSSLTPSSIDIQNSAIHKMAASGDLAALRMLILDHDADVNLPMKEGTTPVHCAVENNREACLRLLLSKGGNASALRDDRVTPVHIAAAHGHATCLRVLLEQGAAVNNSTQVGDTALHLAADCGHLVCCQLLLRHGANMTLLNAVGRTALHHAVLRGRPDVLSCLLERLPSCTNQVQSSLLTRDTHGMSPVHLAAQLPSEACLRLLLDQLPQNINSEDSCFYSLLSIASPACRGLLHQMEEESGESVYLAVELKTQLEGATVSCTCIGNIDLSPSTSWPQLEEQLVAVLSHFLTQLDQGLRTRRLSRLDTEAGLEDSKFTLGITMTHINMFEMGFYRWSPGMQTEKLPYSIASNNTDKKAVIIIDGTDNLCELIAFDILHPVSVLNDYLRLLGRYKSVVFHGPVNSGKSYLVQRLAQCLASERKAAGEKPAIYQLKLSSKTTHEDFFNYLKEKGCLLRTDENTPLSPILILDNLEKINMASLFGPLLDPIAHRGLQHAFSVTENLESSSSRFYFPDQFCILATLNRNRSTGIELHMQQRFRWVQFRHDAEPLRNLLARHFLRRLYHLGGGKLPLSDDPVLQATVWIICIWHRLNDSLGKLGLPDIVFGPCCFFKCPLEKRNSQLILQWVQELWNSVISPQVREAVKKGTGSKTVSHGQHKVANTALYVLMQRSIVLSCPLPSKEKEAYLQGFSGSNELDLPFKSDKGDQRGIVAQLTGRHVKSAHRSNSDREGPSLPLSSALSPHTSKPQSRNASPSPASKSHNKHREERGRSLELFTGSNIKRRSLSESSVNKASQHLDQLEQQEEQAQEQLRGQGHGSLSHHAKVPKLEVRSSKILSLSNSFKTSPNPTFGSGVDEGKPGKVGSVQLAGRLSSHHHHYHHKKSRSSENISFSGLYSAGKLNAENPFSFSLSTPRSSLASFRFFDKSPSSPAQSASSPPSISSVFTGERETKPTDLSTLQTQLLERVQTSDQWVSSVSPDDVGTTHQGNGVLVLQDWTAEHSDS